MMKREADEDMESPQKRPRSGNNSFELRILIPSRAAGFIIGKGGFNITRLRSENKASITIPGCPGPERLISISADDESAIFDAVSQILPLLKEASKERTVSGASTGTDSVEIRLLYHQSLVGCIIGKGGATVASLREAFRTTVKVYGTCCPRSSDRVVAISGPCERVLDVIKRIAVLIADTPLKRPVDPYDPLNFDDSYDAANYGGFAEVGGQGRRERDHEDDRERDFGGSGRGFWRGDDGGSRRGGGGNRYFDPTRRDERGFSETGSGHHHHQENYEQPNYVDEDVVTTQVTIPNELAGAIIGKAGSRIKRTRLESGTSITIGEALAGSKERIITIVGSSEGIRLAQNMMQRSVTDNTSGGVRNTKKF